MGGDFNFLGFSQKEFPGNFSYLSFADGFRHRSWNWDDIGPYFGGRSSFCHWFCSLSCLADSFLVLCSGFWLGLCCLFLDFGGNFQHFSFLGPDLNLFGVNQKTLTMFIDSGKIVFWLTY